MYRHGQNSYQTRFEFCLEHPDHVSLVVQVLGISKLRSRCSTSVRDCASIHTSHCDAYILLSTVPAEAIVVDITVVFPLLLRYITTL